jgi:glycosyltransferase involved in cell wall biosynthesis
LERLRPVPYDVEYARRLGVEGKKVFTYAGTHADYQGLDLILDAAKSLSGESEIVILMVGKGPERERLKGRANEEGIANVLFKESPFEETHLLMSISYASLVTLRDIPAARKMRLSKAVPPLACGVPVIYSGVGESADIIRDNGCGIVVPPENARLLADAILELSGNPERREALGKAGLRLAQREFSWQRIVGRWLEQIEYRQKKEMRSPTFRDETS